MTNLSFICERSFPGPNLSSLLRTFLTIENNSSAIHRGIKIFEWDDKKIFENTNNKNKPTRRKSMKRMNKKIREKRKPENPL